MAKGSGTTKSVGSGAAGSWRSVSGGTFNTSNPSGLSGAQAKSDEMRKALNQFKEQNGWKQGVGNSIWNEASNSNDNIQSYSITVVEAYNNGKVTFEYETRLTGAKSAMVGSKDFDQFQKEFFGGDNARHYNSLAEAQKGLREQIKKFNKMKIS